MPRLLLAALAIAAASGCTAARADRTGRAAFAGPPAAMINPGRLSFEVPADTVLMGLSSGLHRLASDETGTAWVYVPEGSPTPRPLLVVFHGAQGQARDMIDLLRAQADARGLVLLAPQASGPTWDLVSGKRYGQDAAALQRLMGVLSGLVSIDPARVGVAGFSDGASYALSLGLDNGDLFHSVLAFSPGFSAAIHRTGSPRVFVSHGVADPVLDIDRCSRALVPRLRELGYGVTYQEFQGKHAVPPEIASAAVEWFARG